jgi:hypothetical protein
VSRYFDPTLRFVPSTVRSAVNCTPAPIFPTVSGNLTGATRGAVPSFTDVKLTAEAVAVPLLTIGKLMPSLFPAPDTMVGVLVVKNILCANRGPVEQAKTTIRIIGR